MYDICGVCDGDGSSCCSSPFASSLITIDSFQFLASSKKTIGAGETIKIVHKQPDYTFTLVKMRLDIAPEV